MRSQQVVRYKRSPQAGGGAANQTHAALGTAQWSCSGRKAAAVREPSHGSPRGTFVSPSPPSSILEAPCLSLGSKAGAGVGRQGVSWATCEADCRSQDLQLEPNFPPLPQASLHTSKVSSPASQLHLVSSSARKRGAALAGAGCCWKSGPPQPGVPGPSPALLAAGEHRGLGVKPSPTSQPQHSRHQLGQGTFPRLLVLFQQGQGCPCPPVALGFLSIARVWDLF